MNSFPVLISQHSSAIWDVFCRRRDLVFGRNVLHHCHESYICCLFSVYFKLAQHSSIYRTWAHLFSGASSDMNFARWCQRKTVALLKWGFGGWSDIISLMLWPWNHFSAWRPLHHGVTEKGSAENSSIGGRDMGKGKAGKETLMPVDLVFNVYHHADVGLLCLDHPVREKTN